MAELNPEDLKDIQGFVISGYAHLPCVSYLLLQVSGRRQYVSGWGSWLMRSRPAKEKELLPVSTWLLLPRV